MLKQRVVTAVALLAVFLAAAAAGRQWLDALLALMIGAAAFEWLRLAQHGALISVTVAAALAGMLYLAQHGEFVLPVPALSALLAAATLAWLALGVLVLRGAQRGARLPHPLSTALAALLLGAAWFALMRLVAHGLTYLLSVLAIVWLADIAAYFAGRRWGRRKLAPAISPGKTWAGVGGAVVAVLAAALALAGLAPLQFVSLRFLLAC